MAGKKASGKRELLNTGTDKRYAKRNSDGTFSEMDDVSKSLRADARKQAKKTVKPGFGDQGDQKRKKK